MQLSEDDFKRLDEMDKESNARMSERDFTQRLLPHLIPREDGTRGRVDIWVAATGSAVKMLDVFDSAGKYLFTVPPLISQTPMVIRNKDANPGTDIAELAAEFEAQVTVNHPGMVIESFVSRLMSLSYSEGDAISAVYGMMWAGIYKRYNIPLERLFGKDAPEVESSLKLLEGSQSKTAPVQGKMEEFTDDDIESF